jgi:hypothetical protein
VGDLAESVSVSAGHFYIIEFGFGLLVLLHEFVGSEVEAHCAFADFIFSNFRLRFRE